MRLAHVSDLHLLSTEGTRLTDFANKRWTGGVNLLLNRGRHYKPEVMDALVADINTQGVDHVACTGDVTNLALAAEFRYARGFFDRFALGPAHVTCIPGNHDTYVAEAAGAFEREFAPYAESDAGWRDGLRWPIVRERGDVAIIGLSTSQASPWFFAWGELGPAQLARTEALLADPRLAGKFRVVLIHHPPAGRYTRKRHRALRDHGRFADLLARTGAELVLHGHEHLPLVNELYGPDGRAIPVLGVQSGTYDPGVRHDSLADERRARYRIYTIERGQLVGEVTRAWQPEAGRFETEAKVAAA